MIDTPDTYLPGCRCVIPPLFSVCLHLDVTLASYDICEKCPSGKLTTCHGLSIVHDNRPARVGLGCVRPSGVRQVGVRT